MKKMSLCLQGLINAVLVGIYIFLVALFMFKGSDIFGKDSSLWGPFTLLLVFVLSACVMGILVIGKPVLLYLEGQKKEGVKLLCITVGWIFIITAAVLLLKIAL